MPHLYYANARCQGCTPTWMYLLRREPHSETIVSPGHYLSGETEAVVTSQEALLCVSVLFFPPFFGFGLLKTHYIINRKTSWFVSEEAAPREFFFRPRDEGDRCRADLSTHLQCRP